MQAQFISAALATILSFAGAPGLSSAAESLNCDVEPLAGSRHIPAKITLHLQLDQNLATVRRGGVMETYEQAVLADVKQRSADSYVLEWVIQQQGDLGNQATADVQYRAVLNTRNMKISVSATELGRNQVQRRGAGICIDAGR
ncbi:hypothetical protein K3718_21380 (plasmid) [Leisingera aquaemixtae]|uniref:Uncharacterized protein n=1 Tax=Leisingera aquaemixtae TaxID=1396826 RepID=A0ABY5WRL8_9RHOB|nr:hypothetical protein [Leisingera aquaemixtae]UWQ44047.1 hypothetical protein K3718_21380 [Leisingera aquaemixtae]